MGMIDRFEMPRKMCPIIFLLDTSGSMTGAPIGAVNAAIENFMPEFISMNDSNPDVEIKVAVMTFSDDAKWIVGGDELLLPEDVLNSWNDLNAGGATSMGAALNALNEKLSISHGFLKQALGFVAPVLILFMDGEPTDDYKSALQELKKNNWYKVAVRVAVGYGDSNDNVLSEFTGNSETVLHTIDPNELKNMIRFIAIPPEIEELKESNFNFKYNAEPLNICKLKDTIRFVADFSLAARNYDGLTSEELKTILQIIGNVSSRAVKEAYRVQYDEEEW